MRVLVFEDDVRTAGAVRRRLRSVVVVDVAADGEEALHVVGSPEYDVFVLGALMVASFAAAIALLTIAHDSFWLGPLLAFWLAYILTRPPGGRSRARAQASALVTAGHRRAASARPQRCNPATRDGQQPCRPSGPSFPSICESVRRRS